LIALLPLILITLAALAAALAGLPAVRGRLSTDRLGLVLALAPLAGFLLYAVQIPAINTGEFITWSWLWLPSLDLSLSFYIDRLAMLFALIVTFIGILVTVYAGQYFKKDAGSWRFFAYLLLFMVMMLGLVTAGDVLTLFIFWEGTSILSFLLVAYKTKSEEARQGAFRALLITGGGGIALLGGLLFVSQAAGGTDWQTILTSGDLLRAHPYYLAMLGLIAFGAFTKSAQFPAHIWLPGAMSAPTPASAYLHSATMVKAGIYLMARMNPALGFTESWFWLLTTVGAITMVGGAYLAFKQNDWKALLAYSTISQLGILIMLIGQDDASGYKALVVGVLAHALYKSALFLVAGIVDHETGTRDLRRLGGLRRAMPFTFATALVAALSMAGLPPMFGFLAKETLLASTLHPSLPETVGYLLTMLVIIAGALTLAQAGLLIWETFMGRPKDETISGHEASWAMWLAPAIPAFLSLVLSILPGPKEEATLLAGAATDAFGESVKVSFELFHGLNAPLIASIIAITTGTFLFFFRAPVRRRQIALWPELSFNWLYRKLLWLFDTGGAWAVRLQGGQLRTYLAVILGATITLLVIFAGSSLLALRPVIDLPAFNFAGERILLQLFALLVTVGAALATLFLRQDIFAVIALGTSGLSVALIFIMEPAPDVALVQIVVDLLAVVILLLALSRLPGRLLAQAPQFRDSLAQRRAGVWRDALLAIFIGGIVAALTFAALSNRPRGSDVTPYYVAEAKDSTGATDIVGAIVVDFRAMDTLIEIAVFSIAGLGISGLLRYAAKKHNDRPHPEDELPPPATLTLPTYGIAGARTSSFIRIPAYVTLPLSLVYAATHMMYGHDQPGDGFTAGVIIALAVALWYVVFGYAETRARLPWLKPSTLISLGLLLAIVNGAIAALVTGSFFGNVDYSAAWDNWLPAGFHISTSFLFEVAICLAVLGSAAHMLGTMAHPEED
jgi:NADH:ubiquinone oxidoreductase subunit 5 (subunit L)/multisubunit Na+/H+ antiporter MnhA subunit